MSSPADRSLIFAPPSRLRRAAPLLGLLVLLFVLARLDGAAMARALSRLDVSHLLLASVSFAANLLLKGLRWWRMLAAQKKALPPGVALAAFFGSQFYGQVTIGRVGEFFRAEALMERGHGFSEALSSCVVDRLFDVVTVCLVSAALGGLLTGNTSIFIATVVVATGILAMLGLIFISSHGGLLTRSMKSRLSVLGNRPNAVGWFAKVTTALGELAQSARPLLRVPVIAEALLWTAASWVLYFGALFVLAGGLGLQVPWLVLSGAASLAALSALLPVTVSGLGAREVIYQQVLSRFAVSGETAVVLSLLHLMVMSLTAMSTGFCGLWVRRAQRRRSVV